MNVRLHFVTRCALQDRNDPRRGRRGVVALAAAAVLAAALAACERPPTELREREVLLGGLFSLTGNWSTLGVNSQAAMELAIADVNQHHADNPARVRFVAAIEDTRLEPPLALERSQALRARGAQVLIGPQSSAEVAHLKPYVDANGLLLVGQGSEEWGTQRSRQAIPVGTVALAEYLTGPVDYLKLDIEGAEVEVLPSIKDRLPLVGAVGIEFHGIGVRAAEEESRLVRLLRESGFEITVTPKARGDVFPPEITGWVRRVQPYISVLDASRTERPPSVCLSSRTPGPLG